MSDDRKAEAQDMLDQLWQEELIPFALTVGKIIGDSPRLTIHFYDSRISTAEVNLGEGQTLKEGVRAAVLNRVARMSGPLANWYLQKAAAGRNGR